MSLDTDHLELSAEQTYVDAAYRWMSYMRDEVAKLAPRGIDEVELEQFLVWQRTRVRALSDLRTVLIFGRIDDEQDDTFYIGRHHVRDDRWETVVVDWRAPISQAFYQAHAADRMSLKRRRHFLADGPRLLGIGDDTFTADGVRASEILERELARKRGPQMRDIVATIQSEQDALIRAPLDQLIVVQGGPGTGKTAIGLHRAAYLLYEHRAKLEREGVLVVGPNRVFIRYVEDVLPSLGESTLIQIAVDDLAPLVKATGTDTAEASRIKGDVRMATVIARALLQRSRAPIGAMFGYRLWSFGVTPQEVTDAAAELFERGAAWAAGRDMLRDRLLVAAYEAYRRRDDDDMAASFGVIAGMLRRDPSFRKMLDQVWPAASPQALIGDLLTKPAVLLAASEGVLTSDERAALRRKRGDPWTVADRALLDEAQLLIDGPPMRYAHIVADEAQDLSPMQLRMLARRSREGSMTVLGDLGQATGAWAHDDWAEVLEHLPPVRGAHVAQLRLGFRVGGAIMRLASRVLASTAPNLVPPTAVRAHEGAVEVLRGGADSLGSVVAAAAGRLLDEYSAGAVICPASVYDEVREAMVAAGLSFADASLEVLAEGLSLVPVSRAKGLEFDAVVLVEPRDIVEESGARMLYVTLTRAMRHLVIVHRRDLPAVLQADS